MQARGIYLRRDISKRTRCWVLHDIWITIVIGKLYDRRIRVRQRRTERLKDAL